MGMVAPAAAEIRSAKGLALFVIRGRGVGVSVPGVVVVHSYINRS